MNPRSISIQDFTYHLPPDRIAMHPLPQRHDSRLLIFRDGVITHDQYFNLPWFLSTGSQIVFNNTRVVAARLIFTKPSGGRIEIFCLEPAQGKPDISAAMKQRGSVQWCCLIGGASKWKTGQILELTIPGGTPLKLSASYKKKLIDSFVVELSWTPASLCFAEVLQLAGSIPLPPYLHRQAEDDDGERYQTVYAVNEGSVAAPTAGLHFTDELMKSLEEAAIQTSYITLHVGAGTFRPVKAGTMENHEMHAEFIEVSIAFLRQLLGSVTENVIAVGTTSLRTLESLYWIGVAIQQGTKLDPNFQLDQWYPYDVDSDIAPELALSLIINYLESTGSERLLTRTRLLVVPGYRFRIVNILITNFHQPESTLLLLVAAFVGESWRKIYDEALANDYRFLSYGDGCLLFRQ